MKSAYVLSDRLRLLFGRPGLFPNFESKGVAVCQHLRILDTRPEQVILPLFFLCRLEEFFIYIRCLWNTLISLFLFCSCSEKTVHWEVHDMGLGTRVG